MASKPWHRLGCFSALILGSVMFTMIVASIAPWAFRIDGQWTPASWWGLGKLRTQAGVEYPLYIFVYPDFRNTSRLRLNGVRSSSGLQGSGWLCSAQGVTERMDLTGDIYGAYLSTDGKQVEIRLLDARRPFRVNVQQRRYVDFIGRWRGPELAVQDDGGWERGFHPGPHNPKERATVTFTRGSYSDFNKMCAAAPIPEKARIAPPTN